MAEQLPVINRLLINTQKLDQIIFIVGIRSSAENRMEFQFYDIADIVGKSDEQTFVQFFDIFEQNQKRKTCLRFHLVKRDEKIKSEDVLNVVWGVGIFDFCCNP